MTKLLSASIALSIGLTLACGTADSAAPRAVAGSADQAQRAPANATVPALLP